jgi:hypothetical protein
MSMMAKKALATSTDHYTTPDDAAQFWAYLDKWQAKLGLGDWRITKSPKPAVNALAQMEKFDWEQRMVTCRFGNNWKKTPITAGNLEQTAVHELLHVLLYELIEASKYGGTQQHDLGSVEHGVINRLERVLVPTGSM